MRLWKKIYKNALKSSDISITLDALIALGDLSRILGNFKNAIVYYEEAFEVAQALKDEICQADALVGIALSKKGDGTVEGISEIFSKSKKNL